MKVLNLYSVFNLYAIVVVWNMMVEKFITTRKGTLLFGLMARTKKFIFLNGRNITVRNLKAYRFTTRIMTRPTGILATCSYLANPTTFAYMLAGLWKMGFGQRSLARIVKNFYLLMLSINGKGLHLLIGVFHVRRPTSRNEARQSTKLSVKFI